MVLRQDSNAAIGITPKAKNAAAAKIIQVGIVSRVDKAAVRGPSYVRGITTRARNVADVQIAHVGTRGNILVIPVAARSTIAPAASMRIVSSTVTVYLTRSMGTIRYNSHILQPVAQHLECVGLDRKKKNLPGAVCLKTNSSNSGAMGCAEAMNLQKTWKFGQADIHAGLEIAEQVTPRHSAT